MMKYFKYKVLFFVLVFIGFIVILYATFFHNENIENAELVYSKIEKSNLVYNISFNSNQAVYNYSDNCLYFPDEVFLKNNKIKVYSQYNTKHFIEKIDETYYLFIYSDKFYQKIPIKITNVPVINIVYYDIPKRFDYQDKIDFVDLDDSSVVEKEYSNVGAQIMYKNYDNIFNDNSSATISLRGVSSLIYDKKPYKLKFDKKISIMDIKDDVVALDALMTDRSKIRNLLSSNLWNIINDNQFINNDMYGYFFELFINGDYVGLYSLKNKVNSDVTAISNKGVLLKSIAHSRNDYIDNLLNSNFTIDNDGYFLNYQVKKYNDSSLYSIIEKLKDYYSDNSYESIYNNFDFNNYINYLLFVSLISGSDNLSYNRYLSLQNSNSKILITPWDMDLTWGLNWSDDADLHSVFSMESSSDINWMNENITKNMDSKTLSLMKQRYWELRKNVITMDTINGYLDSYKELLVNSGAAKRDSERWYEYDVEFEIEQIREWARRRIEFLDEYFK